MPTARGYTTKAKARKLAAAAAAVSRARAAIVSSRRSYTPIARRGFYGQWNRPGALGPELKTIDVTSGPAAFATTGAVLLLNGVATGTDYNTRVGRKILLKSMNFKLSTYINSACPNGDIIRTMIVYDTQANGAAPTVANILQTVAWDSPMNLDNRDRFKVLYDKYRSIPAYNYAAGAITTGDFSSPLVKVYKRLSYDVNFSGTGATVGSIATGSVYLLTISFNGSGVGYYVNSRIRFIDQ